MDLDRWLAGSTKRNSVFSQTVSYTLGRSFAIEVAGQDEPLFIGRRTPASPGEENWFHVLYPGISENEGLELERDLGLSIWSPAGASRLGVTDVGSRGRWAFRTPYHDFLFGLNGGRFFAGHLNFFGIRRNDPWKTAQPLELASENSIDTLRSLGADSLVFGGYRWDGSLLVCYERDDSVVRYSRKGELLNKWSDFNCFLRDEFKRLNLLFDDDGYLPMSIESTAPKPDLERAPGSRGNPGSGL